MYKCENPDCENDVAVLFNLVMPAPQFNRYVSLSFWHVVEFVVS